MDDEDFVTQEEYSRYGDNQRTNEHLHVPDEQVVSCCEVKVGMKRKARDSQDSSHHIVGESLQTVTEGTAAKLDSLKRTIQRQQAAPVQPTTLEQIALPEEYKRTSRGEQFLLYDSGPETQRILIFGTQRNLKMLQLSTVQCMVGRWHFQGSSYTVHTSIRDTRTVGPDLMKDDHLLPSLFVLLPNKTEATYTRMWQQVQLLCPQADPAEMLVDFEMAAINSFQHTWPAASCYGEGFFFHLTQNL